MITALALGNKIPAVYPFPRFAVEGGLIAYGVDLADQLHNAGGYAARILKGENPADLPIQTPTRYALTINIKTAKALGLTVPAAAQNVRFWHKADIPARSINVRYWG